MSSFTDQLGRTITLPAIPRRIISLVPSQTELLADLGLEQEVVGITKFCIHPDSWFREKQRVGGTKDFKADRIRALQPDLILANKEENTEEGLRELMEEFPVWVSDIRTLSEAMEMIDAVSRMCGRTEEGQTLLHAINSEFQQLDIVESIIRPTVAYFIWQEPWMLAGTDTFISDMLHHCGWQNYTDQFRYPEIDPVRLQTHPPDYIFLSSEPFPFSEKHLMAAQERWPSSTVLLVDGEYFSWYGSRLKNAPSYFNSLRRQQ